MFSRQWVAESLSVDRCGRPRARDFPRSTAPVNRRSICSFSQFGIWIAVDREFFRSTAALSDSFQRLFLLPLAGFFYYLFGVFAVVSSSYINPQTPFYLSNHESVLNKFKKVFNEGLWLVWVWFVKIISQGLEEIIYWSLSFQLSSLHLLLSIEKFSKLKL